MINLYAFAVAVSCICNNNLEKIVYFVGITQKFKWIIMTSTTGELRMLFINPQESDLFPDTNHSIIIPIVTFWWSIIYLQITAFKSTWKVLKLHREMRFWLISVKTILEMDTLLQMYTEAFGLFLKVLSHSEKKEFSLRLFLLLQK